ncbi:hypothetical protein HH308_06815 [Gordonia sp. TBRC 11910]|uniref:Uncharacterized protein n=1 Tax=Gordonia asplenii TaxID=2725283 RepID=A0A848KPF6_9ACTN|nr:hypothetical protein [Gordonia asplenii]
MNVSGGGYIASVGDEPNFGVAGRERADIAAALWWAGADDADAEHLIAYLSSRELLLNAAVAWFKGLWGILAVTTERVLMVAAGSDEKRGFAYELPAAAVLGFAHGDKDGKYFIGQLQDYESWTKIFTSNKLPVDITDQRIFWLTRKQMSERRDQLDKADDAGVRDQFKRFMSIREAQRSGGLDEPTARDAIARIFA